MCLYLRQFNISMIISLMLLNIILGALSFISFILFLQNLNEYKEDYPNNSISWAILVISLVVSMLASTCVYYFGMRSVYFKMRSFFSLYLASLISYTLFTTLLLILNITLMKNSNLIPFQHFERLLKGTMIIDIILIILYLITLVSWLLYKKRLQSQFEEAPLNNLLNPETLSDELYNNIIEQSINPEDKSLKNKYRKLSSKKAHQSSNVINNDSVY